MSKLKNILCISHHAEVELGIIKSFLLSNNCNINIAKPLNNTSCLKSNINDLGMGSDRITQKCYRYSDTEN